MFEKVTLPSMHRPPSADSDMEYASQDEVRILALRHQREIGFLP